MRSFIGIATLIVVAYLAIDLVTDGNLTLQGCSSLAATWSGGQ